MIKPGFYGVEKGEEIQVILPQASEEYGPISHYYLIVVPDDEENNRKNPDQFLTEDLLEDKEQKFENDNAPYIAAKFPQRNIPYAFHLGRGDLNGGFLNRKLDKRKKYRIVVSAVVDTPEKNLSCETQKLGNNYNNKPLKAFFCTSQSRGQITSINISQFS